MTLDELPQMEWPGARVRDPDVEGTGPVIDYDDLNVRGVCPKVIVTWDGGRQTREMPELLEVVVAINS